MKTRPLPPPPVDAFSSPVVMCCALAWVSRQGGPISADPAPLPRRTLGAPGVPSRTVGVSLSLPNHGGWFFFPITEVR